MRGPAFRAAGGVGKSMGVEVERSVDGASRETCEITGQAVRLASEHIPG